MKNVGGMDVSRETFDKMQKFVALVQKWTPKINLIGSSTVNDIWDRHVVDSAQLYPLSPPTFHHWLDLGSGGGFPGIIMAIIGLEHQPNAHFTLIESDNRKSAFLRTAVRELSLQATVIAERIENTSPKNADVISARALGSLSSLLPDLKRHLHSDGAALLHKGRQYKGEMLDAQLNWSFELNDYPSITDSEARLLEIKRIQSV